MWLRSLLLVTILLAGMASASHGWARLVAPVALPPSPSPRALQPTSADLNDLLSSLPLPKTDVDVEIDLFGNEINHALAKYKVDRAGGEYEVHSPDTEMSRLTPPAS